MKDPRRSLTTTHHRIKPTHHWVEATAHITTHTSHRTSHITSHTHTSNIATHTIVHAHRASHLTHWWHIAHTTLETAPASGSWTSTHCHVHAASSLETTIALELHRTATTHVIESSRLVHHSKGRLWTAARSIHMTASTVAHEAATHIPSITHHGTSATTEVTAAHIVRWCKVHRPLCEVRVTSMRPIISSGASLEISTTLVIRGITSLVTVRCILG